ncbi:glycosyltransferase [Ferruginibacter paludis]|uniref:glycosyltransferase n=1 Tax=Ferruginibacter paludis TaxID=1310417 RepID=UPI0025B2893A|nr:glycosyltransferase [Ferruginibacter paludis]MDN3658346.1 glycosyltransferase [Ferruginibacter paludis]
MQRKNILFISYDGMTDPLGQSQVIPYLSNLTKFGYRFTILSCDKPDRYAANRDYVKNILAPYAIQWVSVPYHKKPPVLSSLYDFYILRSKAKQLHAIYHFDMVHTRPGLPSLVGVYLKNKFGIKFLNDIRGFWADERVDGGIWNLKNPLLKKIYRFFKAHEKDCLEKADYSVCVTYKAKEIIHSRTDLRNQPVPVEVIPCSADMELFDPEKVDPLQKAAFSSALNISSGDFIITYLGSLGGWYLTDEIMRFCKAVSNKIPGAKFLFISPDSQGAVAAAAVKYGLADGQVIVQYGKRHEVPVLLSFSNYAVFFIKTCYSKQAASPVKHGEIMSMGIPVITNSGVGDLDEIVEKQHSGYLLPDFSEESFTGVVQKIVEGNPFDKKTIRNSAAKFYSLTTAVERYKKVYDTILS